MATVEELTQQADAAAAAGDHAEAAGLYEQVADLHEQDGALVLADIFRNFAKSEHDDAADGSQAIAETEQARAERLEREAAAEEEAGDHRQAQEKREAAAKARRRAAAAFETAGDHRGETGELGGDTPDHYRDAAAEWERVARDLEAASRHARARRRRREARRRQREAERARNRAKELKRKEADARIGAARGWRERAEDARRAGDWSRAWLYFALAANFFLEAGGVLDGLDSKGEARAARNAAERMKAQSQEAKDRRVSQLDEDEDSDKLAETDEKPIWDERLWAMGPIEAAKSKVPSRARKKSNPVRRSVRRASAA